MVATIVSDKFYDITQFKLEMVGIVGKSYRVSQKKVSLVKISCGKYCSGWREIHVEYLTNPCSVQCRNRASAIFIKC